jgi:hypothetical protein
MQIVSINNAEAVEVSGADETPFVAVCRAGQWEINAC